jgi:LPXTG-motif cell wall-anchored protein
VELPQTLAPSSDARILTWVGGLAALTAGALWVSRRRRAPRA